MIGELIDFILWERLPIIFVSVILLVGGLFRRTELKSKS